MNDSEIDHLHTSMRILQSFGRSPVKFIKPFIKIRDFSDSEMFGCLIFGKKRFSRSRESSGAFGHFYETSEVEDIDEKHYLANESVVETESIDFEADERHSEFRISRSPPDPSHQHISQYIDYSGTLPDR